MDSVEKAIRNAFERGDQDDPRFRDKVYRSVHAALEKAIAGNPALTAEQIARRRAGLETTIATIEAEFIPAIETAPPPRAPNPEPRVERRAAPADTIPPPHQTSRTGAVPHVPEIDDLDIPEPEGPVGRFEDEVPEPLTQRPPRRRSRFAMLFVVATVLAGIAMGLWWAVGSGFFLSEEERMTEVPNPPATVTDEDFTPAEEEAQAPALPGADAGRDWITVFGPSDASLVSAPSDAEASVVDTAAGQVLRIRSGPDGSAVLFDVGVGILERLAGKRAVFDISARSEDGKPTQMSVLCNFGELGDCGRKRYAVSPDRGEFLFEVQMSAATPGAQGTIAVVSDVENAGKAVEIFEIRVSTAE